MVTTTTQVSGYICSACLLFSVAEPFDFGAAPVLAPRSCLKMSAPDLAPAPT